VSHRALLRGGALPCHAARAVEHDRGWDEEERARGQGSEGVCVLREDGEFAVGPALAVLKPRPLRGRTVQTAGLVPS
jgi:hypothetical protein